ncbi:MAG: ATP-binding protein, partial [bacterium]
GIAHELNNPIGIVAAAIEPLRAAIAGLETQLDAYAAAPCDAAQRAALAAGAAAARLDRHRAELPSLLDDCAEGARRSAEIVGALRTFARGGAEEEWRAVDLTQRLERTLTLLRHRLAGRRVVRDFATAPRLDCLPGQLDQVWLNLLANACDAVGNGGTIRLSLRVDAAPPGAVCAGPHLVVAIGDDGPGMTPAVQARVFEPFFTTKPEGSGTGLGLSVSYGIVERHAGAIRVTSAPGRGSVFTVALPLQRAVTT